MVIQMGKSLIKAAEKVGLKTNEEKTEYMMEFYKENNNTNNDNHENDGNNNISAISISKEETLNTGYKEILQKFLELFSLDPVINEHLKEYIKFCLNNNLKDECRSGLITIMARRQDVQLYITAANFELNTCESIERARHYYELGIREHSQSVELTYSDYSLEIYAINKEGEIDYERCFEKYKAAIKRFVGNINVHMEILKLTLPLKSDDLNSRIVNDMVNFYGYGKSLWEKLYELRSQGYTYNHDTRRLSFSADFLAIPNSGEVYKYAMKMFNVEKNCDDVMEVFREGLRTLKEHSLPLWVLMLSYLKNTCPDLVEQLFIQGIRVKYEMIATKLRPAYLIWRANYKGLNKARVLYDKRLIRQKPYIKQIHKTMLRLELENEVKNVKRIRKVQGVLCRYFAKDDIKIWSGAMRFEYMYGVPCKVEELNHAAMYLLEPEYKSAMTQEYEKLKMEFKDSEQIIIDDDDEQEEMELETSDDETLWHSD
ncbi:uncharacterized protein LOC126833856 [Adelges cooleyi]|uniref:uncharacterized protein LOC126833856 n=1 Tax=Adelges cooleyi TaxID=133065 RepID=UPI00217F8ACC|nr:uncharacterized protein LOC126833856 [Adelges cooleyi]